jgi:hypothetical protein
MFKIEYIKELLNGQLSEDGYTHFVQVIGFYIRKYRWPKSMILTEEIGDFYFWSQSDIKELAHQYFEWIIIKGKLKHCSKIPDSYLSYYFLQMFISFVADLIKQLQSKNGLSYQKISTLVTDMLDHQDLVIKEIHGVNYYFNEGFDESVIVDELICEKKLARIPKIIIKETGKHHKSHVEVAIQDIFNFLNSPVTKNQLIKYVYSVFDQTVFQKQYYDQNYENDGSEIDYESIAEIITKIIAPISKIEAKFLSDYLFGTPENKSLSDLEKEYGIPKSTIHHRVIKFKQSIVLSYTPGNEDEGVYFLKKLAQKLDEYSN